MPSCCVKWGISACTAKSAVLKLLGQITNLSKMTWNRQHLISGEKEPHFRSQWWLDGGKVHPPFVSGSWLNGTPEFDGTPLHLASRINRNLTSMENQKMSIWVTGSPS